MSKTWGGNWKSHYCTFPGCGQRYSSQEEHAGICPDTNHHFNLNQHALRNKPDGPTYDIYTGKISMNRKRKKGKQEPPPKSRKQVQAEGHKRRSGDKKPTKKDDSCLGCLVIGVAAVGSIVYGIVEVVRQVV